MNTCSRLKKHPCAQVSVIFVDIMGCLACKALQRCGLRSKMQGFLGIEAGRVELVVDKVRSIH